MEDSPHFGLKRIVTDELMKHKKRGKLKLSATKHSALIDFLSCFPSILSKAAPYDTAAAGFLDNGMVDSKLFSYPDLHTLIGTYKTIKFRTEVERIVNNNFNKLCEERLRAGQLPDTSMESFGFCLDTHYEGDWVMRVSECEAWQREKCMSATYQRDLHKSKMESYKAAITIKDIQLQEDSMTMNHANERCIEKLISAHQLLYPQPQERNVYLSKLAMMVFSKCPLNMLKGFIYVHVFNDAVLRLNPEFT